MSTKLKNKKLLTIILFILVLIFGLFASIEFYQNQSLNNELGKLKEQCATATLSPSANGGYIVFQEYGPFEYKRVTLDDWKEGDFVTLRNVTFHNLPLNATYTGCIVRFVRITFPDGAFETIQITSCPTLHEPSIVLTNHSRPKAGIIYAFGESFMVKGIYLLVQEAWRD